MKRKFKLIVPSFLAIIFCLLLIAGSTFALFTSEASASISVTSGKVDVSAELIDLKAYSAKAVEAFQSGDEEAGTISTGNHAGKYIYEALDADNAEKTQYTFTTGGSVELNTATQALSLERMVAGDRVTLKLKLTNESNVKVKYRVRLNALTDNGLLENLTFNLGNLTDETVEKLVGVIKVGAWHEWQVPANEAEKTKTISLELFLPLDNESMNSKNIDDESGFKSTLKFTVEMVQGNAKTDDILDQVNAYLVAQSLTAEGANKTMWDAIQDADEWLALPENAGKTFEATNYLWNMDTDQFYSESSTLALFKNRYFKAYTATEYAELNGNYTYNIYALGNWSSQSTITLTTSSFDAGDSTGITQVNYTRAATEPSQTMIIRTNSASTNVAVNAPNDVVYRYGIAGSVVIDAIAGNSYHECGKVAFLEVSKGRVALEETSKVEQIHISSIKEVVNNVEQTTNKFDEIIIAIHEDAPAPTFSRDDVEIASQGTLVVALQQGTQEVTEETELDYVWLTKQGIFEQIKVTETSEEIKPTDKWADELSSEKETTKTAAFEIANNISRTNDENKSIDVKVVVEEGTVNETTYVVQLNNDRDLVVVEQGQTQELATLDAQQEDLQDVTVGEKTFTVELKTNQEEKSTEIILTNKDTPTEVIKAEATKNGGLTEAEKKVAKEAVVEEAVIDELGNDENNIARIKAKVYTTLKAALEDAVDGDTVVLLQDRIGSKKEVSLSINKNIILDLGNKTVETATLTVYSLDTLTIKNGTINGQLRVGEHQYTKAKYKTDGSYMNGYHPLAPAKNVVLNNVTINSGNKVALYFTNIEDDLTRVNSSNPVDRDLYGKYIYKTGYTSKEQYEAHNRDDVFTACTDKDKVTIINCNINSDKTITGNMHEENIRVFTVIEDGRLYTEVLDVQSGTFNNDSLGRFVPEGKYLVGLESGKFVVQDTAPTSYTARINNVYYTYEGGANDAITYANLGETVYIRENADVEKTIGRNQSLTVVYEEENISFTGATPILKYNLQSSKDGNVEVFYTDYVPVAEVYRTSNNSQNPAFTSENLIGTYPTVAEAFAAATINGQFSMVRLIADYEGGDDAKYYYVDTAYSAGAHSGSSVRFDLNGYTWTYTGTNKALTITTTSGSSGKATYIVDSSQGKTGKIEALNGTCIYKENSSSENTYITGGTFIAKSYALNINKLSANKKAGRWYISDGTFVSNTTSAIYLGWTHSSGLLEITGGSFTSGGTAKAISGFTVIPCSLKGGTYSTDPSAFATNITVASGKTAVDNGDGTWTVQTTPAQ